MIISGLQRLSLLDYPDKLSCVVFTPGCNLRCGYCHNSEFVLPEKISKIKESFLQEKLFFSFLEKRRDILDGVSICGGEPTMHKNLPDFCRKIRALGFLIKLDTNGCYPDMIEYLLDQKLVDYIAMDIKHTWEKYSGITGKVIEKGIYERSIRSIISRAPDYEFRTTIIEGNHTMEDVKEIVSYIDGAKMYYLQNYRSSETLDPDFIGNSFSEDMLHDFSGWISTHMNIPCKVRV